MSIFTIIVIIWFTGMLLTAILGGILKWDFRPDLAVLWPYGLPRMIILNKQIKQFIEENNDGHQKQPHKWE